VTPPCTNIIIKKKIKKVFYSVFDPDKRSKKKSKSILKKKKIFTQGSLLKKNGLNFYQSYYLQHSPGLPLIDAKIAISKDYFSVNKRKKWITNFLSRNKVHLIRSRYDCILSTYKTVNKDNSRLNCRIQGLEHLSPSRVIIDKHLKLKKKLNIYNSSKKIKTYVITSENNKKKENILALIDVSLQIPKGSLFGLLGLNGAGKSTIINILAGLCLKNSGTVKINNYNIETKRKQASCQIGIVPQELNFDPFFTPKEILELQAGLYGIKKKYRKTMEILKDLDLHNKANSYTRSLSGGMKRRLMIAKALVHNPSILVLDEPTAGVDVTLRQQLWKYIKNLKSKGKTILLTTHYIEEAERLCDRICIVNNGKIVLSETKKKIMKEFKRKKLEDIFINITKS